MLRLNNLKGRFPWCKPLGWIFHRVSFPPNRCKKLDTMQSAGRRNMCRSRISPEMEVCQLHDCYCLAKVRLIREIMRFRHCCTKLLCCSCRCITSPEQEKFYIILLFDLSTDRNIIFNRPIPRGGTRCHTNNDFFPFHHDICLFQKAHHARPILRIRPKFQTRIMN